MKKTAAVVLLAIMILSLTACGASSPTKTWDISVVNTEGTGVEGVDLQICSDNSCYLFTTDADGTVNFSGEQDSYEVHVLRCPEEYAYADDSITVKKGEKCKIVLEAAAPEEMAEEAEQAETDQSEISVAADEDGRVKISFSTVDMQGNIVDDSIFAQNKLTMINLWEPWCGPCKSEMPDLQKLYQEYKDQGFMILGVHEYEDDLESVVADAGVTYPIVNTTDEFKNIVNETCAYPTSFFVDNEGYVLLPTEEMIMKLRQKMTEEYKEYYQEEIEAYQNGELDEYRADEENADFFAELDEMIADSSKLDAAAEEAAENSINTDSGYFVGANDYDNWKILIEGFLSGQ